MINFLSSWVKNLSLALIIVSILEMILPDNKTKKYVKMVMGLYILFSIISPFMENSDKFNLNDVNLDFYKEDIEETSSISTEVDQSSMDKRLDEIYKEELQKDIIQKGYEVESCKVTAHISETDSGIEKIVLKIKSKMENETNKDENSLEEKIVTEIQKIQKVEINSSKNNEDNQNSTTEETTKLTKTDIKIITDFLIKEYGVNEECLRIS